MEKKEKNGWKVQKLVKTLPKLHNAVLIEGLPGIGNIGKITVDFIVDELRAEKLFRLQSLSMPNTVFIGDNNLIDVPRIDIYYKKFTHKPAVSAKVSAKKRKTRPTAL